MTTLLFIVFHVACLIAAYKMGENSGRWTERHEENMRRLRAISDGMARRIK